MIHQPKPRPRKLLGGPLTRRGGKGRLASRLIRHFARASVYAEPFLGAGHVFFSLPTGSYERHAINDLEHSIVTFFRVLRDQPEALVRRCEATPYAREEFRLALAHCEGDDLELARRVWVRGRQNFAGNYNGVGNWGRTPGDGSDWAPQRTENKLADLDRYAAALRGVAIDSIDGARFVDRWGQRGTFVYCDPPYVPETRTGTDYLHEMTEEDHRRLAASLHAAVERGAHVAISGYPSALYNELFAGWRVVTFDVPLYGTRHAHGQRRTEVLWCSYPASEELGAADAASTKPPRRRAPTAPPSRAPRATRSSSPRDTPRTPRSAARAAPARARTP